MKKQTEPHLTGEQALERLLTGNKRFVRYGMLHPNRTQHRRQEILAGQHPFAVILGCSDSRVPPEIIFDQGLGDIFVIRVAGNILSDVVLGSIEFAVQNFESRLIVVLGHSDCGAVKAAMAGNKLSGHLSSITSAIQPAVDSVKNFAGDKTEQAIRTNALNMAKQIRKATPILSEHAENGSLEVVASQFHLQTGLVEML